MKEWRIVEEFPKYEISNEGGIRRILPGGKYRVLKPAPSGCYRYLMVTFTQNHKYAKRYLHRMVAQTFLPNPDPARLTSVGLKDKDGTNCRVDNLYWTNQQELMSTRRNDKKYPMGPTHHFTHLTEENVIEMRSLWETGKMGTSALARKYGVHPSTASSIVHRITWKHVK